MSREIYILTRKALGDTRTVEQIGAEFDALAASLASPPPDPLVLAAAVKRSETINAWLLTQKPGEGATAEQITVWDTLRRLPFNEQAKRARL